MEVKDSANSKAFIFVTLSNSMEEINPNKYALIIWDMQYGIASRAFNYNQIVTNIRKLLEFFHKKGLMVIYSQHTGLPYELQSKYNIYRSMRTGADPKRTFMAEHSREWEIVEDLRPLEGDIVVKKHTPSFFIGTPLELYLRNRGIDYIVLTGVSTEIGIEGTARHGAYLGFIPIIIEDAVGSFDKEGHEYSLRNMRKLFEVKTTEELIKELSRS